MSLKIFKLHNFIDKLFLLTVYIGLSTQIALMSLEISKVKLGFFEKGNNVFKTKEILGFGPAKTMKFRNLPMIYHN